LLSPAGFFHSLTTRISIRALLNLNVCISATFFTSFRSEFYLKCCTSFLFLHVIYVPTDPVRDSKRTAHPKGDVRQTGFREPIHNNHIPDNATPVLPDLEISTVPAVIMLVVQTLRLCNRSCYDTKMAPPTRVGSFYFIIENTPFDIVLDMSENRMICKVS